MSNLAIAPRQQGIPLRADVNATARIWKNEFVRASTVDVLAEIKRQDKIAKGFGDFGELVTRGPVEPLQTGDLPGASLMQLKLLAPRAASIAVLDLATKIDLKGIDHFQFPLPESFSEAKFVGEGSAIPVAMGAISAGMVLGPTKKIALIAGLSGELETATGDKGKAIIAHALEVAVGRGLDKVLFSGSPPSGISPAGLLYNVTPITAGASMSEDLAALVGKISSSGINPESIVFVAAAEQATTIKLTAGPFFNHRVIGANLPPGQVIAIASDGLAYAGQGVPKVEVSKYATLHMEGTNPQNIGMPGPPTEPPDPPAPAIVAAPVISIYQAAVYALKCSAMVAWVAAPGAVQVVNGVVW